MAITTATITPKNCYFFHHHHYRQCLRQHQPLRSLRAHTAWNISPGSRRQAASWQRRGASQRQKHRTPELHTLNTHIATSNRNPQTTNHKQQTGYARRLKRPWHDRPRRWRERRAIVRNPPLILQPKLCLTSPIQVWGGGKDDTEASTDQVCVCLRAFALACIASV